MDKIRIISSHGIFILLTASYVTTDSFQPVSSSCVYWDFLDLYSNGDTEKLHCILDEKGQLGIVNVRWKWVEQGFCPYFDHFSKQIHVKPCDAKLGYCPDKEIFSYQAVKYSACIEANYRDMLSLDTEIADVKAIKLSITKVIQDANSHSNILTVINIALSVILPTVLIGLYLREQLKRRANKKKGVKLGRRNVESDVEQQHYEMLRLGREKQHIRNTENP